MLKTETLKILVNNFGQKYNSSHSEMEIGFFW